MKDYILFFLIVLMAPTVWIWLLKFGFDFSDEIENRNNEIMLPAVVYDYLQTSPADEIFTVSNQADATSQYNLAVSYLRNGNMDKYDEAYELLEKFAKAGIPSASYFLGMKYLEVPIFSVTGGIGKVFAYFINMYVYFFNDNYHKAFDHIENSADQGYVEAQYFLSEMYAAGIGTEKNISKACRWFEAAYKNDHF